MSEKNIVGSNIKRSDEDEGNGNKILIDGEDIKRRWKEYFGASLNEKYPGENQYEVE